MAGYRAKWTNEINLEVVIYEQCRTPFVVQLLLSNNKKIPTTTTDLFLET